MDITITSFLKLLLSSTVHVQSIVQGLVYICRNLYMYKHTFTISHIGQFWIGITKMWICDCVYTETHLKRVICNQNWSLSCWCKNHITKLFLDWVMKAAWHVFDNWWLTLYWTVLCHCHLLLLPSFLPFRNPYIFTLVLVTVMVLDRPMPLPHTQLYLYLLTTYILWYLLH